MLDYGENDILSIPNVAFRFLFKSELYNKIKQPDRTRF